MCISEQQETLSVLLLAEQLYKGVRPLLQVNYLFVCLLDKYGCLSCKNDSGLLSLGGGETHEKKDFF